MEHRINLSAFEHYRTAMIGDFSAVGSIARFAVELMIRTLKRLLVHFVRQDLEVTAFSRALNKSKIKLNKHVIVNLIDTEFSTASVVRSSNHSLIIYFGGQWTRTLYSIIGECHDIFNLHRRSTVITFWTPPTKFRKVPVAWWMTAFKHQRKYLNEQTVNALKTFILWLRNNWNRLKTTSKLLLIVGVTRLIIHTLIDPSWICKAHVYFVKNQIYTYLKILLQNLNYICNNQWIIWSP